MTRKLVDIPNHESISEQCFTDLKSAFDNGKGIETDRAEAWYLVKHARNHIRLKNLPFKARIKSARNGSSIVWIETRSARRSWKRKRPDANCATLGRECFAQLQEACAKGKCLQADRTEAYRLLTHARNYISSNKLPFKARIKTASDGVYVVWLEDRSRRLMKNTSPERSATPEA